MQPIPPLPPLDELTRRLDPLMGTPAVAVIAVCALIIVSVRDWRVVLTAVMALYLALALLTASLLPPEWALLRVVTGGLVAIMWYLSAQAAGWGGYFLPFQVQGGVKARPLSSTTAFRLVLALALAGVLLAIQPRVPLPPLPPDVRAAVGWLAAFALLGLALGDEALQGGSALLMWLAGTQLIVAALSRDSWLIWLVTTVELLLGLATAYLIVARGAGMAGVPPKDGH